MLQIRGYSLHISLFMHRDYCHVTWTENNNRVVCYNHELCHYYTFDLLDVFWWDWAGWKQAQRLLHFIVYHVICTIILRADGNLVFSEVIMSIQRIGQGKHLTQRKNSSKDEGCSVGFILWEMLNVALFHCIPSKMCVCPENDQRHL